MKEKGKILISLLVMLVVISNISYSVTLSICRMSMKSTCSCDMPKESKDETIKRKPCCKEQVKDISNSSDFLSQTKSDFKVNAIVSYNSELCIEQGNFSFKNTPNQLIFYKSHTDLPVKYSSLLI